MGLWTTLPKLFGHSVPKQVLFSLSLQAIVLETQQALGSIRVAENIFRRSRDSDEFRVNVLFCLEALGLGFLTFGASATSLKIDGFSMSIWGYDHHDS